MIKVAVIGAGSIGFTRKLMSDILTVPELQDTLFHFTDISGKNLNGMLQLAKRDISENEVETQARIEATLDRREAVTDADYVINTSRVGGMPAFELDIDIPLKYGIDQCVGDTLAPGGIMYGQRGIAAMDGFCKDIREASKPNVLMLNYGNPNAMLTWAANLYFGVNCIGLCHGVEGGHNKIAKVLGLPVSEVDIICAGINHQTWYTQIRHKGRDIAREELLAAFENDPQEMEIEKCRIDMLKRTGYFSTESNGHLSEYLAWYRKREDDIQNWIHVGQSWIHGETGGYFRICNERRDWFDTDFPAWMKQPVKAFSPETRSHEHGSYIIEGLETGRRYRGHFNVVNNGSISNLPNDAIVEVPGYVDGNGVSIPQVGDLPHVCAAICNQSIWVQRMAVQAAVDADVMLLKQAMMMDPLAAAVCNPPEIWQMTDEMLVAQAEWLPQYADEIPRAQERLASEPALGTRSTEGWARFRPEGSPELRQQKENLAKLVEAEDAEVTLRD
ncbi:MAG: alpha-galactosidase [Lentisphaerae bacterium]|jgi:alpha-galactosidase|nr:alpha-galactosidase [Lentisphaerota bacterium]MBT4815667.1 alpha-galactosidase [Lentisphaerota bacterium]MBT5609242.1 alpha-galactosidase [Lentisphaerota bacterium]MBT7059879.1 alpha-galactosidase [Lentisphaerota bacterium]MBT7847112.1 alpha-galactosidase [Lentisphaerota bacterium]